ncbi:MAG: hypothetical protein NTX76_03100 [Alphaproteobacteria bacterium]|nr:hypothetical protein [Alphaproteobacteria bacterium]
MMINKYIVKMVFVAGILLAAGDGYSADESGDLVLKPVREFFEKVMGGGVVEESSFIAEGLQLLEEKKRIIMARPTGFFKEASLCLDVLGYNYKVSLYRIPEIIRIQMFYIRPDDLVY